MAGKGKFHKNRFKSQTHFLRKHILIRERNLLRKHYDFLDCSIRGEKLICTGKTKPTDLSSEYIFELNYDGLSSPSVFVKDPVIEYNDDIHMFPKDKSLCLFHSKSDNFIWDSKKHNLHDTIIPWTQEWFIFYELYLITGKWEHPFHPHLNTKKE